VGPFRLRPLLLLKDVGYDDNVLFEEQQPHGDTTATLGASLDALLLGGHRGGLRMLGEADYVTFKENGDLDHWNGSSRARGILVLRRAVLSLEDRFDTLQERPSAEIDQRIRRENNALSAAYATLNQGRLGARAYLRRESIDYHSHDPGLESVGDLLNREENTLAVVGEVWVLPKTTFTLEGNVQRIDFDDVSQGRNTRTVSILSGFRFDPSASIQGDLKIGRISLRAPDQPENDFHGTVGEGHLSTRLGHFARLKGSFGRSLVFSILVNNLYFISTSWSAAYEQFFSRRLSAEFLYGRALNHYPNEVILTFPVPFQGVRDDRVVTYQTTIRYRIGPQLNLYVAGSRLVRNSTDDALDRVRNLYSFGTTYAF